MLHPSESERLYGVLRARGLRAFPKTPDPTHEWAVPPSFLDDVLTDAENLELFGYPVRVDATVQEVTLRER
jgi:hypothetical protein